MRQQRSAFLHGALQPVHAEQALQRARHVVGDLGKQGLIFDAVGAPCRSSA
jgi:hypothetical protein